MAAFTVSYSYSDRRIAQKVCQDLISRFVDESVKSRSQQSLLTTEFFKDQYDLAKKELDDLDKKIADFRTRNMGQLPEQEQMVLSRLTAMEASIQATDAQISRASQDKVQLESQLREAKELSQALAQAPPPELQAPTPVVAARNERLTQIDREIERLEAALTTMRESYRETHPDVQKAMAYLQSKQKQREKIVQDAENAKVETVANKTVRPPVANPNQAKLLETNSTISRLQSSLQAKDIEIEGLGKQLRDYQNRLKTTQSRLEAAPGASQEYVQLMRDRELAATRYQDLSRKMQSSSMATDLENRKQGEMLEVLEQPAIPEEPYAPKRPIIIAGGLILGLGLGIALSAGREMKDTSLKNLKDVRAYTRLTVLGSIPLLENDFVTKRRRRMAWLAWTAAFLVGVLLMAGAIVYYYTSQA
jgi:uncharacterized protein involved in exopolysaccharide biosynthesis